MLVDQSVRSLLEAFRSPAPTPGGGSASALASAVGASLLLMVAALPKTRGGTDDDRAALAAASASLERACAELTSAVDADTAAYDRVVAAYKMPKTSAGEQAARKAAVQSALQAATDVPLGVMRESVRALEAGGAIAAHGHKAASSDVGVALALLTAGIAGARLNVDINLDAIGDSAYRDRAAAQARDLQAAAGPLAERARTLLG